MIYINTRYMYNRAVPPRVDKVYFNEPYTIVLWTDHTKTIVKAQHGDTYSRETGLAMCFMKKSLPSQLYTEYLKLAEEETKPKQIKHGKEVADSEIRIDKKGDKKIQQKNEIHHS